VEEATKMRVRKTSEGLWMHGGHTFSPQLGCSACGLLEDMTLVVGLSESLRKAYGLPTQQQLISGVSTSLHLPMVGFILKTHGGGTTIALC
jgi:hypothetical protein